MDDELDVVSGRQAHFEHSPGLVGTDEHCKFVELENSDRVPIRGEHVVVGDLVPSSAGQYDGIHLTQYILTLIGRSSPQWPSRLVPRVPSTREVPP
jgi:hypothetical protein